MLNQAESATVGRLLDAIPSEHLSISDFSLHSIGVILGRLKQNAVFVQFVQDVVIDGSVSLLSLPPSAMQHIVAESKQFRLDFDDAYQYCRQHRIGALDGKPALGCAECCATIQGRFAWKPAGRRRP